MRPLTYLFLLACLSLLTACGGDKAATDESAATEQDEVRDEAPASKTAVLPDGDSVMLRRYESEENFPLAFTTYFPSNFAVDQAATDGIASVRYGTGPALLSLNVLGAGVARDSIDLLVRTFLKSRGEVSEEGTDPLRLRAVNDSVEYRVEVGRRYGRAYYWLTSYPSQMAAAFGPRAALVRAEFGWIATRSDDPNTTIDTVTGERTTRVYDDPNEKRAYRYTVRSFDGQLLAEGRQGLYRDGVRPLDTLRRYYADGGMRERTIYRYGEEGGQRRAQTRQVAYDTSGGVLAERSYTLPAAGAEPVPCGTWRFFDGDGHFTKLKRYGECE